MDLPVEWRAAMLGLKRAHARRVFEEALARVQREYTPAEDVMAEARYEDAEGRSVVVARYKLYTDGRVECFDVLDEVLWPSL
jgi:hypothetical protein